MNTASGTSSKATTSLVLGILGLICCGPLAPIAWYMGNAELNAIKAGQSSAAGEGIAKAGKITGIIGTIFFGLTLLWIFFAGGMAVIQGLSQMGGS